MATTITTSTSLYSTSSKLTTQRRSAYDSTGRLWVVVHNGASSRLEMWYSDDGSSFTEATSLRTSTGAASAGIHIDRTVDRCLLYMGNGGYSDFLVCHGITSTGTWNTMLPADASWNNIGTNYGEAVTFTNPNNSAHYILAGVWTRPNVGGSGYDYPYIWAINMVPGSTTDTANPTYGWAAYLHTSYQYATGNYMNMTMDFRHTGDGSTVVSPDIFAALRWPSNNEVYAFKWVWDGTTWGPAYPSIPTGYDLGNTATTAAHASQLCSVFDGTRYIVAWVDNADTTKINISERDAGNTTTTPRTITALSDGAVTDLQISYTQPAQDLIIHAKGTTSDDIKRCRYIRATNTWESWTTIEATTALDQTMWASKGWASGKGIAVGWQSGTSPYNVVSETDFVNNPPTAPTWVTPVSGAAADRGAALTLDWAFQDPDAGDAQTAYKIKRSVNGGAASWWTGAAWGAETKITTATTSLAMSSGWGTDGDTHVYNVLTYDAADVVSPYSANLSVVASVPDNPTITAPATSATVTTSQPTISWTVTTQTAYQLDIYETDDSLQYTSGKITSASTSITCPYVLANGLTDLKFKITTWNDAGLICSTPDTNTLVDVTYTPPATPVLTVTAVPASGYISVAIADPAPGATPQVVYHDVYVRVASGGTQSGERTVNDNGIRISTGTVPEDGTFYDRAAASGVSFQYRTQAFAANGATTYSAWTG